MDGTGERGASAARWMVACLVLGASACTGAIEQTGASAGEATGRKPFASPGDGPAAGDDDAREPGGSASPGGAAQAFEPPSPTLRRLTPAQYRNSVRDLLEVEPEVAALTAVPPLSGLSAIGASSVALAEVDLEHFERLAGELAARVFDDEAVRSKLVGCDAQQPACAEQFVTAFGRRAFRRPLADDERARYLALLRTATQMTGDGWLGLRVVSSAFLQSPAFLYRAELGEPSASGGAARRLTDHELASRLSFFLWNTTPDDALLDAADSGALQTTAGLLAQAERLLQSPRASAAIDELLADYLRLEALDGLVKLADVYPATSDTLAAAMKQETLLSLRTLVFERALDFRQAFTTTTTFVDRELAELYGVTPPASGGFAEVTLPADGPRAGLLTHGSFLAAHAHPARTSPTRRGKFIRESLLCQAVPAPPPDVDTSLPDTSSARTLREKLTRHREDPACSGCHALMDPLGLSLEHFDGIGAYRSSENGVQIDASGELDGVPFDGARGLGEAIAGSAALTNCFTRTVLRYARGAVETRSEEPAIDALASGFEGAGHRVPELLRSIATSSAFRHVGGLP